MKRIGLALSGGGARGFAHLGVLRVLLSAGIKFDVVAGTSAGSILGAMVASGMSIDAMNAMATEASYSSAGRPTIGAGGFLSNLPLGRFLKKHLPVHQFESMPTQFAAIAYDLVESREVVLSGNGDVIEAVRASCAVPGIFSPVRTADGRVLVDGGVTTPMPTRVVREMGPDIVIGIDVISCGSSFRTKYFTTVGIVAQSGLAMLRSVSAASHHYADHIIEPAVAHLRPDQISKRDEFLELGESAGRAALDEVKRLIDR